MCLAILHKMSKVFIIFFVLHNIINLGCATKLFNNNAYSGFVNNSKVETFCFNNTNPLTPSRVTVSSLNASRDFPILIVVRQQRQVMSWQLPLLVDTTTNEIEFNHTSRTLCPDSMTVENDFFTIRNSLENISVSLSTSSPENIFFTIEVSPEVHFHIMDNKTYKIQISPSAPKIFFYQFPEEKTNDTMDETDVVLLRIDSEDSVCMFVSVQNSTCPVYDLEHDIRFEGFWETVSNRGGLTVPKSKFPKGFFIIFVSKSEDITCKTINKDISLPNREKTVTFSIIPGATKRNYITAVLVTVLTALAVHLFAWIFLFFIGRKRERLPMNMTAVDAILDDNSRVTPCSIVASRSFFDDVGNNVGDNIGNNVDNNVDNEENINDIDNIDNYDNYDDHSSLDETEYDTITEAFSERQIYRTKPFLFVCDLAKKPSRLLQKKSYLYLWHVLTVAVFYGLPVVQLVVTYQKVLSDTGNQDLCYYNFLCAHPLGLLSDFNHVFSNLGYVMLGILFITLIYRRERWHNEDFEFERQFGIPQHHGLFYAMGTALIMEGILSASYHVCPNHTNFQFDSSFMYIMAVLCMVKIYQNRHPDINATAYATFGVLAAAISLGMLGILAPSVYFWVGFTILHLTVCFLLTIQIYYMGCYKFDRGIFLRIYHTLSNDFRAGPVNMLKPVYKGRMCLLVLGNVWNWALAVLGLLNHDRDFATYLLAIFMSNTLLYTLFYITMKILHKERIMGHAILFILLATLTWGAAMYFFIHKSISWALTPAESRGYNQACQLLEFYDPHDIWHFLSAFAMFFSFMILLTLDDDISHTHRSKIHVF